MRALSGSVTAGLVVLTAVVVAAAIIGGDRGFPGPGTASVTWHVVAVVAALVLQHLADHRTRAVSVLGSLGVLAVAGALLWTQWWN
ncbi:hypothetical protein [Rhodococcoides corynebacterioides]|uniref:Uncharacterized protein n=1 Tax=Rhodococcoides corynebacterioides TaxID=53972 RepID=A0ABS7NZW6_9NOCA|nr:hypothetical protein [Rhodococcus corynebacterioides]MBY6365686.1 hypothetical protein [Rhodococcus corynebacterioides]MBY6406417.1 hypothetical protein [Rhodococcus corynebacterioides]